MPIFSKVIFTFVAFWLLAKPAVFAAGASVSASQLALYQGADREKILVATEDGSYVRRAE